MAANLQFRGGRGRGRFLRGRGNFRGRGIAQVPVAQSNTEEDLKITVHNRKGDKDANVNEPRDRERSGSRGPRERSRSPLSNRPVTERLGPQPVEDSPVEESIRITVGNEMFSDRSKQSSQDRRASSPSTDNRDRRDHRSSPAKDRRHSPSRERRNVPSRDHKDRRSSPKRDRRGSPQRTRHGSPQRNRRNSPSRERRGSSPFRDRHGSGYKRSPDRDDRHKKNSHGKGYKDRRETIPQVSKFKTSIDDEFNRDRRSDLEQRGLRGMIVDCREGNISQGGAQGSSNQGYVPDFTKNLRMLYGDSDSPVRDLDPVEQFTQPVRGQLLNIPRDSKDADFRQALSKLPSHPVTALPVASSGYTFGANPLIPAGAGNPLEKMAIPPLPTAMPKKSILKKKAMDNASQSPVPEIWAFTENIEVKSTNPFNPFPSPFANSSRLSPAETAPQGRPLFPSAFPGLSLESPDKNDFHSNTGTLPAQRHSAVPTQASGGRLHSMEIDDEEMFLYGESGNIAAKEPTTHDFRQDYSQNAVQGNRDFGMNDQLGSLVRSLSHGQPPVTSFPGQFSGGLGQGRTENPVVFDARATAQLQSLANTVLQTRQVPGIGQTMGDLSHFLQTSMTSQPVDTYSKQLPGSLTSADLANLAAAATQASFQSMNPQCNFIAANQSFLSASLPTETVVTPTPAEEPPKEEPPHDGNLIENPMIKDILKSIGFDFEMSKRMQERAKQVTSGPQQPKKKVEAPKPETEASFDEPQFGINQTASFLGGGLSTIELKSSFFEKQEEDVESLIRDAQQNVRQAEKNYRDRETKAMQFQNQEAVSPYSQSPSQCSGFQRSTPTNHVTPSSDIQFRRRSPKQEAHFDDRQSQGSYQRDHMSISPERHDLYGDPPPHAQRQSVLIELNPAKQDYYEDTSYDQRQLVLTQLRQEEPDMYEAPPMDQLQSTHTELRYSPLSDFEQDFCRRRSSEEQSSTQEHRTIHKQPLTSSQRQTRGSRSPSHHHHRDRSPSPEKFRSHKRRSVSPEQDRRSHRSGHSLTPREHSPARHSSGGSKYEQIKHSGPPPAEYSPERTVRSSNSNQRRPLTHSESPERYSTDNRKWESVEERTIEVQETRTVVASGPVIRRTVLPPKPEQAKIKISATFEKVKPREVKPMLSQKDRESLMRECADRSRRLDALHRELERLRKQQNELMRKKQRQKDGHKDPILLENSKLQEEIAQQISSLRKAAEENAKTLKDSGASSGQTTKSEPAVKKEGRKEVKEEKVKKEMTQDPSSKKPSTTVTFEYFDPGNHWCPLCNHISSNIFEVFQHLRSKKHLQKSDPYDRPWMPESLKNPSSKPANKGHDVQVTALKGVEFMRPAQAFYCALCKEFSGDEICAEHHLKSPEHNDLYKKFVRDTPFYERGLTLDKAAGVSAMPQDEEGDRPEKRKSELEEEMVKRKKMNIDEDKKRMERAENEKKEQLERNKEKRQRGYVKKDQRIKESLKKSDKTVGDLSDERTAKSDSSAQGKEIKLKLKGKKDTSPKNQSGAFSNFHWNKKAGDVKPSAIKPCDAFVGDESSGEEDQAKGGDCHGQKTATGSDDKDASAEQQSSKSGKIAIKLTGKTRIKPKVKSAYPGWTSLDAKAKIQAKLQKQSEGSTSKKPTKSDDAKGPSSLDRFLTIGDSTTKTPLPVIKEPVGNQGKPDSKQNVSIDLSLIPTPKDPPPPQNTPITKEAKEKLDDMKLLGIDPATSTPLVEPKPPPPVSKKLKSKSKAVRKSPEKISAHPTTAVQDLFDIFFGKKPGDPDTSPDSAVPFGSPMPGMPQGPPMSGMPPMLGMRMPHGPFRGLPPRFTGPPPFGRFPSSPPFGHPSPFRGPGPFNRPPPFPGGMNFYPPRGPPMPQGPPMPVMNSDPGPRPPLAQLLVGAPIQNTLLPAPADPVVLMTPVTQPVRSVDTSAPSVISEISPIAEASEPSSKSAAQVLDELSQVTETPSVASELPFSHKDPLPSVSQVTSTPSVIATQPSVTTSAPISAEAMPDVSKSTPQQMDNMLGVLEPELQEMETTPDVPEPVQHMDTTSTIPEPTLQQTDTTSSVPQLEITSKQMNTMPDVPEPEITPQQVTTLSVPELQSTLQQDIMSSVPEPETTLPQSVPGLEFSSQDTVDTASVTASTPHQMDTTAAELEPSSAETAALSAVLECAQSLLGSPPQMGAVSGIYDLQLPASIFSEDDEEQGSDNEDAASETSSIGMHMGSDFEVVDECEAD